MNDNKNKNDALSDYFEMITKAWTWEKMTLKEQHNCIDALGRAHLKGTWVQRWEQLHDLYYAFLLGLDYKPIGWREEPNEDTPKF